MNPSKILCIGQNYACHAAEMDSAVPAEPIIFLKPPSALIGPGDCIVLPDISTSVHHEVELVIQIARRGKCIARNEAMSLIKGYAVGLDLTARDIQTLAKNKGHPWSVAKGFDTFAPLGEFCSARFISDPQSLDISLAINGEVRQSGNTGDMIFDIPFLIEYVSNIFTLMPGDLIYTGTPEGVGPLSTGDTLVAKISGLPALSVRVQ